MNKSITDSHMRFLLRVLLVELLAHRMLVFGGLLSNPRLPLFFAFTIPFSIYPQIFLPLSRREVSPVVRGIFHLFGVRHIIPACALRRHNT
jgi:hypothetical protein